MSDPLSKAARRIHVADANERLRTIVDGAAASMPGIDAVSVSEAYPDGRLATVVSSGPLAQELDSLQSRLGEGPCVYAAHEDLVVRVGPARSEQRWPAYMAEAVSLGLTAQLGMRISYDEHHSAALNLYSTSVDRLADDIEEQADVFAAYAAMALGRRAVEGQLRFAIETRRVIGQAIGIVMTRYQVDDEQAFRYLGRLSSHENVKLRDLAARLVAEQNALAQDVMGPTSP